MSAIADRIEYRVNAELGGEADVKHVVAMVLEEPPYCAFGDLFNALKTLVSLKDHKDANGADEHYRSVQPLVWNEARAALARAEGRS